MAPIWQRCKFHMFFLVNMGLGGETKGGNLWSAWIRPKIDGGSLPENHRCLYRPMEIPSSPICLLYLPDAAFPDIILSDLIYLIHLVYLIYVIYSCLLLSVCIYFYLCLSIRIYSCLFLSVLLILIYSFRFLSVRI